jgi:hypothetical protein
MLLIYVCIEHHGHTYRGFDPTFSDQGVTGPITQTKWSHMPITLSSQDINLNSYPPTDTIVTTVHIDRWDVTKLLIDNGSRAEILFLATFNKMGFD